MNRDHSGRLTALAAVLLALAGPAAARAATVGVAFDAGPEEWSPVATRIVHRETVPPVPGAVFRTVVDWQLVDTSARTDLPFTFTDGEHVVGMDAVAEGWTSAPPVVRPVRVDTTRPEVWVSAPAHVAASEQPFTAALGTWDEHSGVARSDVAVDGAPAPWTGSLTLTLAPGSHRITARAVDHAGNAAEAAAVVVVTPTSVQHAPETDDDRAPATSQRSRRRPAPSRGHPLCANLKRGEQCGPGNGRTTRGGKGTGKVSHRGWPAITGVLWKVLDSGDHQRTGGPDNDELLGHHGDDRIAGAGGHDVLWGDWDPKGNTPRQRDVLRGGSGNDWIYPSHGTNRVIAGAGADRIIAFYGHGTIDCGPGRDTAQVRMNGAYRLRGCEKVKHFT